jgi:hypothetical protein
MPATSAGISRRKLRHCGNIQWYKNSVMHEDRQQNDDRQWDAQQPKQ